MTVGKITTVLELYTIGFVVDVWSNMKLLSAFFFNTDNQTLYGSVILKETARDKHIMFLIQKLVLIWLKFDIYFRA